MSRTRNYCFTLNNWTEEEYKQLSDIDDTKKRQIAYMVFGKEEGEEEHTPHLQGFVRFHNAKTFSQVKKFFGDRYHLEKCNGTIAQNIAYCTKDDNFVEVGERPQQGARNDIREVVEQLQQRVPLADVIMNSTSYQAARHAELIYKHMMLKQPPAQQRYIKWIASKYTLRALEAAISDETDYYLAPIGLQHWDGYTGQHTVIINIQEDPHRFLLRLLSTIPCQLNTKGGIRWLQPTTQRIVVTSRKIPLMFYGDQDSSELHSIINEVKLLEPIQELMSLADTP